MKKDLILAPGYIAVDVVPAPGEMYSTGIVRAVGQDSDFSVGDEVVFSARVGIAFGKRLLLHVDDVVGTLVIREET